MNRHERRKQATQNRILDATIALIMEKGLDNISVGEIADCADVGRATFYLHFDGKLDVVASIIRRNLNWIIDSTTEFVATLPPDQRTYLSWIKMFEMTITQAPFYIQLEGKHSAELRQISKAVTIEAYKQNLKKGIYTDSPDLPYAFIANLLAGAILQIMDWWIVEGFRYTPIEMANMMYRMFFNNEPPTELLQNVMEKHFEPQKTQRAF